MIANVSLFLAACIGGLARYYWGVYLSLLMPSYFATVFLNWFGIFLLIFCVRGYLTSKKVSEKLILSLGTGFCGAFTTFSSSLLDLLKLYQTGREDLFFLVLFLVLVGGLVVAYLSLKWSGRLFHDN